MHYNITPNRLQIYTNTACNDKIYKVAEINSDNKICNLFLKELIKCNFVSFIHILYMNHGFKNPFLLKYSEIMTIFFSPSRNYPWTTFGRTTSGWTHSGLLHPSLVNPPAPGLRPAVHHVVRDLTAMLFPCISFTVLMWERIMSFQWNNVNNAWGMNNEQCTSIFSQMAFINHKRLTTLFMQLDYTFPNYVQYKLKIHLSHQ